MSHLRIEDLIADLSDDGTIDSTGSFTLDPSKAEEKLKSFALADPSDYILKAIQFAVASSASKVRLHILPGKVEIAFEGDPVGEVQLREMMAHLLAEKRDLQNRRIRHLAAAMRGALGVSPRSVEFESWSDGQGWCRKWDHQGWRVEPSTKQEVSGYSRFTVKRTAHQSLRSAADEAVALFRGKDLTREEERLLIPTRRSPALIYLDGKPIPRLDFGLPRYLGYDIHRDPNPGEMRPPPYLDSERLKAGCYHPDHHLIEACYPAHPEHPAGLHVPPSQATQRKGLQPGEKGFCRAWLALAASFGRPRLTVVSDGVELLDREAPSDFGRGARVVLAGESFSTDLTGLKVVEDSDFREALTWAAAELATLRSEVQKAVYLYPASQWVLSKL